MIHDSQIEFRVIHNVPDFVANLIEYRQDRDLTRERLAARLNVPVQDITRLELLTEYPDEKLVKEYALIMGIELEIIHA